VSDYFERVVIPDPVEPPCPAAALVSEAAGGTGCVCRITRNLIDSRRNPSTLRAYCFSSDGYRTCPTWRADREELWRSKTIRDLLNRKGDLVSGHPEDLQRTQGLALATEAQEREAWLLQRERER
jgi:hypothetical protein